VFFIAVFKLAGKKIIGALDSKIAQIKQDLESARALRDEAQKLLNDYAEKQRAVQNEALNIIDQAKKTAQMIHAKAEEDLAETMARREAQLTERLKRLEEKAIADLQSHAADIAVKATREIIIKTMDEKTSHSLIDQAIHSAAKHLN
jgi:F-type H+-transporting ATPase subunit b